MFKNIFIYCFAVFIFSSCEKVIEDGAIDPKMLSYFPIEQGRSWEYQSDSVIFRVIGIKRDTIRSYHKEEINGGFINAEGKQILRLERFYKKKLTDPWTKVNTWSVQRDSLLSIRIEENIPFIKLVFPFKKGTRWDGNALFDETIPIDVGGEAIQPFKNWKYRIEDTDFDYTLKNQKLKAIRVAHIDESSIIDVRKSSEIYVEGIGLARKDMTIVDLDSNKPTEPWQNKILKGYIHTLTLIDFK